jgi:uncharacterized protein
VNQNEAVEQHAIGQSLLLHLVPGVLIGSCYYALRPILDRGGYPSMMALMAAVVLILVPVELGYLLYQGKKKNGRYSLQGVLRYRTPIPIWQYILWVPVLLVILGVVFTVMKPVDAFLQNGLFSWVPAFESGLKDGYSQESLIRTYVMVAVFGAVVGPTIEELYFRGFLLPRMGYAGKWAPLLHSFLFALYHLWTPWMFVTRTVGIVPLAYAVQRRNLNLGIIVHILINLVDVVAGVVFIAGMGAIL